MGEFVLSVFLFQIKPLSFLVFVVILDSLSGISLSGGIIRSQLFWSDILVSG